MNSQSRTFLLDIHIHRILYYTYIRTYMYKHMDHLFLFLNLFKKENETSSEKERKKERKIKRLS